MFPPYQVFVNPGAKIQIPCILDEAEPLNPESFPNKPRPGSTSIPATIRNVKHLLRSYGIVVRYNVIKKNLKIHYSWVIWNG